MVRVIRMVAADDEHAETSQRVFCELNHFHRWCPAPPDHRIQHDHHCQPEVRRGQADDGHRASHVVGGRILPNRRVDADWQGDYQPDDDRHEAELNRYRQSTYYRLLYRDRLVAWLLSKGPHVLVIVGASRAAAIEDSAPAADLELDASDLARLDAATL